MLSCSVVSTSLWVHQAPLSMGFSRQECCNGEPFPSPGYLPNQGIEPGSPELQVDSLPSEPPGKPNNFVCMISHFSCIWLFGNPWTAADQAPLSTLFSRQEYWSGLPFPSSGDHPDPWIAPGSSALAGGFFTHCATREARSSNFTSGYLPKESKNTTLRRYKYFNVHHTIIYESKDMKQPEWPSIGKWIKIWWKWCCSIGSDSLQPHGL